MGCLDEVLRDKPGINRQAQSAKAREIENDMDWGSL